MALLPVPCSLHEKPKASFFPLKHHAFLKRMFHPVPRPRATAWQNHGSAPPSQGPRQPMFIGKHKQLKEDLFQVVCAGSL